MGQTVYADLLFLINFSMDYLCFYITAKLLHRKLPPIRTLLASVLGGVYAVGILMASVVPPLELVCDIGAGLAMCLIVFIGKRIRFVSFLTSSLAYVGVSVALGGMMTAIFNMLNLLGLPLGSISESGDGMPVWFFALLAAVSGIATLASGRFLRQKQSERSADIEITYGGKTIRLAAICDSGNLVRDPVSGKSVVIADLASVQRALPDALVRAVRRKDASLLASLPPESARRLRLVPSRTAIGGGMLFAMSPDRLTVNLPGEPEHEVEALFAPVELLSSAGGFQALIPPEFVV